MEEISAELNYKNADTTKLRNASVLLRSLFEKEMSTTTENTLL